MNPMFRVTSQQTFFTSIEKKFLSKVEFFVFCQSGYLFTYLTLVKTDYIKFTHDRQQSHKNNPHGTPRVSEKQYYCLMTYIRLKTMRGVHTRPKSHVVEHVWTSYLHVFFKVQKSCGRLASRASRWLLRESQSSWKE